MLEQGWLTFLKKKKAASKYFGFVGQTVSASTTQLPS